jgi:predicted ATP-dependent serine protease
LVVILVLVNQPFYCKQQRIWLAAKSSALYVTGEESLSQVALRAQRLDLPTDQLKVMAETCVERICEVLAKSVLPWPF